MKTRSSSTTQRGSHRPPTTHAIRTNLCARYPNAYKYSTNDAIAPSIPCIFGLLDSIR